MMPSAQGGRVGDTPPQANQGTEPACAMPNELIKYYVTHNIGVFVDIFGLLLTIIGFAITIFGVFRAKGAAQRADEATRNLKSMMLRIDTVADLSAAMAVMDELKRLHRDDDWTLLPERYSTLRRTLISDSKC